jgi:hypothetical protein
MTCCAIFMRVKVCGTWWRYLCTVSVCVRFLKEIQCRRERERERGREREREGGREEEEGMLEMVQTTT